MTNNKNKNNARNGGAALSSPKVDFINEGHASQARYIAALTNPFASPAVPIPDSFLKAHVSKMGREITETVDRLLIRFKKVSDDATGNYEVEFAWYNAGALVSNHTATSEVGARLVAAGISFEDGTAASDLGGFVTYRQWDNANDAIYGHAEENVNLEERSERNRGYGSLTYKLTRRQMLDFEGDGKMILEIVFHTAKPVIARFAAIMETDGKQGFTESIAGQSNFLITNTMDNIHAGVFADIPHPNSTAHLAPAHADLTQSGGYHFRDVWHAAGNWVSAAAGWAWKHRGQVASWANKAGEVYRDLTAFGGSITGTMDGAILSIGARAAPLLLA